MTLVRVSLSRRSLAAATAGLLVVAGATSSVALAGPSAAASARLAVPKHALHSVHLPASAVHRGSVLVAFRAPVSSSRGRIHTTAKGARHAGLSATAVKNETARVNDVLAGLKATSVRQLFTNIPAAQLNRARARAMKATGRYLTDLTQMYRVTFSKSINDGEAANRLQSSGLVWTAMADFKYKQPVLDKTRAKPGDNPVSAANAGLNSASSLPPNYSYATDGQSYNDAASNNTTGAAVAVAKKFGQQPGQGETITNISLGTIDNTSTVLENGQRFLEQSGFPKIPTFISHLNCPVTSPTNCSVSLDPAGTNTEDGQGDLTEVLLDFSTMAPPPRGDARVPNPQTPGQLGEILGAAYGANYRLINPKVNSTEDFFAAFLGAGFLQTPRPSVITASIGNGLPPGAFPDDEFEGQTAIRDIVSTLTFGQDIFVTISAGDGQTDTNTAGPPNGTSGPYNLAPAGFVAPDLDSTNPADPDYTYLWTSEARLLPDTGSNAAGGTTLNDVFNNVPNNTAFSSLQAHTQTTTETRWTGQQNFHTGTGNRLSIAAPADDVLFLAQVENANGIPVSPTAVEPQLVGGTSASCPEIAAAAAVVRQVAKLTGHPLSAVQTRDVLAATGHPNVSPTFDLTRAPIGRTLDLTAAVNRVLSNAGVHGTPELVRMTVAQRKGVPGNGGYARTFYTDTPQDAVARTATIDLNQGLDPVSSFNNETLAPTGNNLNSPITFGVDAAFLSSGAKFDWSLSSGNRSANVPGKLFDRSRASLRLLPTEIFDLLGMSPTSSQDRVVQVTARTGSLSITENVTFKALASATYTVATSPVFVPLATQGKDSSVRVQYDLRGLRNATSGQLIVSDIDRALPRAFTDRDPDSHGIVIPLNNLVGSVSVPLSRLQGAGTYGLALRGVDHGVALNGLNGTVDSTGSWIPLRIAPANNATPNSPKVQAAASLFGSTTPVWWDAADIEPGGSQDFDVTYDVRAVHGARSTVVEFSAPSTDFLGSLFLGNAAIPSANRFTNPLGDRLDGGNRLGDPGETSHKLIRNSTHGVASFTTSGAGLTTPASPTSCDHTYQIRVFAADKDGKIIGSSSYTSLLSVSDFSSTGCGG